RARRRPRLVPVVRRHRHLQERASPAGGARGDPTFADPDRDGCAVSDAHALPRACERALPHPAYAAGDGRAPRNGCVDARRAHHVEHRSGVRALGRRARRRASRAVRTARNLRRRPEVTSVPSSSGLLGPAEIRDLADALDLQPTKKLGQNFVVDGNTVRKIVRASGVAQGEHVIEVGPGLGSLTLGLLEAGARVTAVEIDARLAELLPHTVEQLQPGAPLEVVHADALRIADVPGSPTRLVAHLPYNVSVPVLLHLLDRVPSLETALVMVQAEVGERIAARPGSKVYGSPSAK